MTPRTFHRREFLEIGATVGAGLLVGFRVAEAESMSLVDSAAADLAPNGYLALGSDGIITLYADHVELGQGVMTALPMIVAEELDADWNLVRIERMSDNPSAWPRRVMTVGTQSVRTSWAPLRNAGATAREMLISAAATMWSVDRSQCRADQGFVLHNASGRRASYGELANAASALPVPTDPPLKDPKTFRIVGTKRPRVDIPSKTNGSAQFGIDVRVPGMLIATVLRPPVFGGSVASFDASAAKAISGVKDVVQFESGLAVLATDTWSALKGRAALTVEWNAGANASLTSDEIRRRFTAQFAESGKMFTNRGDAAAALASSTNVISADYELPFAAHATMEPMNCTAHVRADGVDVWVPTHAPTSFQTTAARRLPA